MKRRCVSSGCLVLALLAGFGCGRNEYVAPPPPEVTVQRPAQRDVTVFEGFPGRIEAVDAVKVRARVSGFLDAVHFRDGEMVVRGAPLFTIEPELYESALRSAEAALAQAQASEQLTDAAYERKKQASRTGAVSELDLLTAEAEKNSAMAAVQAAEAEVAARELDLSYTEVTSPVTGRIGRRLVSVGNLVGGAQATLLTTVVVQDPLHVYFNIDERIALSISRDANQTERTESSIKEIYLELADGSRYGERARLDYIDPTFDRATGTLAVRAEVRNPDEGIKPGMFTRVLVPIEIKDAILVPELAIQRDLQGPYLLVVDEEGMVEGVHVELGPQVEAERIIPEGIGAEDRIIVNGLQRARAGIKVTATE